MSIPSTTGGNLERSGDLDYFRINVSRAGRLRAYTTGSTDTYGTLFRGTSQIARNDDGGSGTNFSIAANVQAGTHYIEVRGYVNTATGPYSLQVSLSGSTPPPTAGTLPFFTPASNRTQRSYARITNKSNQAGTVTIHAIDDTGWRYGPASLQVCGEADKTLRLRTIGRRQGGWSGGAESATARGTGAWSCPPPSTSPPLRTCKVQEDSLPRCTDVVRTVANRQHVVTFNKAPVNPGTAWSYGLLRLINPNDSQVNITISGQDDRGRPAAGGMVRLSLPARGARRVTSTQLEQGGDRLSGRFGGEGEGRWQLVISATRPVWVMNLMFSPTAGIRYQPVLGTGRAMISSPRTGGRGCIGQGL